MRGHAPPSPPPPGSNATENTRPLWPTSVWLVHGCCPGPTAVTPRMPGNPLCEELRRSVPQTWTAPRTGTGRGGAGRAGSGRAGAAEEELYDTIENLLRVLYVSGWQGMLKDGADTLDRSAGRGQWASAGSRSTPGLHPLDLLLKLALDCAQDALDFAQAAVHGLGGCGVLAGLHLQEHIVL